MGAFSNIYPATTNLPHLLEQFEKETVTFLLSSFSFVMGRLRHLLGVSAENPNRIGMIIVDVEGRIPMDGLIY